MRIMYVDEYGELIFEVVDGLQPHVNDTVVFDNEDWIVKHRTIHPVTNDLVISVTQNLVRSTQKPATDGRHNEMQHAILAVNKRQDASEKKGRALNEQISSIRKHINTRIQQEKKDKD